MRRPSVAFHFLLALGIMAPVTLGALPVWAQGNSPAAKWCKDNFPPATRGQCVSQAAHGTGPYYTCGPGGTDVGLCGGACCKPDEVCAEDACTAARRTFLINGQTSSPVLEIASPKLGAACAARELRFAIARDGTISGRICDSGPCVAADLDTLTFFDRSGRVNPSDVRLGAGNASEGPVMPVEGPDDLLWLCREDEEAQQCICIPWFQD